MWWHCLNSSADSSLVCHKSQACLLVRVYSAQRVVSPHLFSAEAEVVEVLLDDELVLVAGQPLVLLLSFAVCMEAMPQVAKRMMERVEAFLDKTGSKDPVADTKEQLFIEVHQPWRIQGQCLLISRFYAV